MLLKLYRILKHLGSTASNTFKFYVTQIIQDPKTRFSISIITRMFYVTQIIQDPKTYKYFNISFNYLKDFKKDLTISSILFSSNIIFLSKFRILFINFETIKMLLSFVSIIS